jgi:hypothetical protein
MNIPEPCCHCYHLYWNAIREDDPNCYTECMKRKEIGNTDCQELLDEREYIQFGDVCRRYLGIQAQYGFRYITGDGRPVLTKGLRLKNVNPGDYHSAFIHKDDVRTLVDRHQEYIYKQFEERKC